MIRICPMRDGPCPHGMGCPHWIDRYTCKPELSEETRALGRELAAYCRGARDALVTKEPEA